jgi:hypothetical protein
MDFTLLGVAVGRLRRKRMDRSTDFVGCIILEPMTDDITTLYRPVGRAEFELIGASGFCRFPPRVPEQPFFYPVLNKGYATQIARDWNTKDESSGFVGYVLRFGVRNEFLTHYEVHTVGSSEHREYWIPAADLEKLNAKGGRKAVVVYTVAAEEKVAAA